MVLLLFIARLCEIGSKKNEETTRPMAQAR